MGLETADTIAELDPLWPLGTDPKSQGDDHIRMIKAVLQNDAAALSAEEGNEFVGDLKLGLGAHLEFTGEGVDPEDAGHIRTTNNNFLDLDLTDPGGIVTYTFRFGRNTDTEGQALQTVFYRGDGTNTFAAAIWHGADGGAKDDAAIVVPVGVFETSSDAGGFRAVRAGDGSSAQLQGSSIIRDGNGISSLMDFALINGQSAGASDFVVRIGRTADAPNSGLDLYNPNTTTRRVQLGSEGSGFVKTIGVGIGVDPSGNQPGTAYGSTITDLTNSFLRIRSKAEGTSTQCAFYGGETGGTIAAVIQASPTDPPQSSSCLITRAMGDVRYTAKAAILEAVQLSTDFADLKARLVAALTEPVDLSNPDPEA